MLKLKYLTFICSVVWGILLEMGKSEFVVNITDASFDRIVMNSEDPWLVEFFAPWCSHCMEFAPEYEKAAEQLDGSFKLGAVNAIANPKKAKEYGVEGYPTVKYFPAGDKYTSYFPTVDVLDYTGGRNSHSIVNWCLDRLNKGDDELIYHRKLQQMILNNALNLKCAKLEICILLALPEEIHCNTKCREEYMRMLDTLGKVYKEKTWGWNIALVGENPVIEEALDIVGYNVTTLSAVFVKTSDYALLEGPYIQREAIAFLKDVKNDVAEKNHLRVELFPKTGREELK